MGKKEVFQPASVGKDSFFLPLLLQT